MENQTIIGLSEAFSMQPVKYCVGDSIWGSPNKNKIDRIVTESLQTSSDSVTSVYIAYDKGGNKIAEFMCGSVNVYYK